MILGGLIGAVCGGAIVPLVNLFFGAVWCMYRMGMWVMCCAPGVRGRATARLQRIALLYTNTAELLVGNLFNGLSSVPPDLSGALLPSLQSDSYPLPFHRA